MHQALARVLVGAIAGDDVSVNEHAIAVSQQALIPVASILYRREFNRQVFDTHLFDGGTMLPEFRLPFGADVKAQRPFKRHGVVTHGAHTNRPVHDVAGEPPTALRIQGSLIRIEMAAQRVVGGISHEEPNPLAGANVMGRSDLKRRIPAHGFQGYRCQPLCRRPGLPVRAR